MKLKKIDQSKKQIILFLSGGLGNQLYQLAFALKVKKFFDFDEILFSLKSYEKDDIRKFELDNFILDKDIYLLDDDNSYNSFFFIYQNLYSKIRKIVFLFLKKYINNQIRYFYNNGYFFSHHKVPNLSSINLKTSTIYIHGYFQNVENVDEVKQDIRRMCKLKNERNEFIEAKRKINMNENSLAISIRCGMDYYKMGWIYCDNNYYKKALKELVASDKQYFIFTDDEKQARKNIDLFKNYTYLSNFTPCEQLILMSECKEFIISNSTFSWWGSYLGYKKSKKVIMPKRWFDYLDTSKAGILFNECIILE